MCQKATEIQALRPLGSEMREGDLLYSWYTGANWPEYDAAGVGLCYPYEDWGPDERQEGDTWLLRQDQLQEILGADLTDISGLCRWAGRSYKYGMAMSCAGSFDYDEPIYVFHSWEQLWLAWLMSEEYGKVWDGEDWIEKAN